MFKCRKEKRKGQTQNNSTFRLTNGRITHDSFDFVNQSRLKRKQVRVGEPEVRFKTTTPITKLVNMAARAIGRATVRAVTKKRLTPQRAPLVLVRGFGHYAFV